MIIIIETIILCIIFSLLCYFGTGTDEKNLKSYSSYPDEVRSRIKDIAEYQGQFKESNKIIAFVSNFLLFLCLLFALYIYKLISHGYTIPKRELFYKSKECFL